MRRFAQNVLTWCLPAIFAVATVACAPTKASSTFTGNYPRGEVRVEMPMKDGKPEGRATGFHENGSVEYQGPYRNGLQHGLFHYWDEDGLWLRQQLFFKGKVLWASRNRSDYPPDDLFDDDGQVVAASIGKQDESAVPLGDPRASEPPAGESTWSLPERTLAEPPLETSKIRFLNGLPAHASYAQLSLGSGSAIPNSSAQRLSARVSYADGRRGASLAINLSHYRDDFVSAWGKPVADLQASYLLPEDIRGYFVVRAGVVLPLGNDDNRAALAGAAGVIQAPNDAIYVLPSTIAARTSMSWTGASEYVVSQIDFGIDIAVFGYPDGVHPIIHGNGAVGVGLKGFLLGAEASSALSWSGTMSDYGAIGGAFYAPLFDTRVGFFAGVQGSVPIFRARTSYDF